MPHLLLESLTRHPGLPDIAWEALSGVFDCTPLVAAADGCPQELRAELLEHRRVGVRHRAAAAILAGAPAGPAERQRALQLACDGPDYMVVKAAACPWAAPTLLERYACDKRVLVARAAWQNPATPTAAVASAAAHPNPDAVLGAEPLMMVRAANVLDAHPGAVSAWIGHKAFQRAAARRTDTPAALWPVIAATRSPITKAALGGNWTVPVEYVPKAHRELHERVCAAVETGGEVPGGPLAALELGSATLDRAAFDELDAALVGPWVRAALARTEALWPDVVVGLWHRWRQHLDIRELRGDLGGPQRRALAALTDYPKWGQGRRVAHDVSGLVRAAGTSAAAWQVVLSVHSDWEGTWDELGELAATLT